MKCPSRLGCVISAGWLAASAAFAGSFTMTVSIDASKQGSAYSGNFAGLSFETGELKPNNGTTGYVLDTNTTQSPKCAEVIQLAANMGVKNIRIGGGTVESLKYGTDYTSTGVDALFSFASRIGANVIYSLRLQGSSTYDPQTDSVNAGTYVWNHYQSSLSFFAIGNEPNFHSYHTYSGHTVDPEIYEATSGSPGTAYPSYVHNQAGNPVDGNAGEWKDFANAVTAGVTGSPGFGGPDTGDEGTSTTTWWNNGTTNISWTQAMVEDRKSGNIATPLISALTHYYAGGSNASAGDPTTEMLSSTWTGTNYPTEFNMILSTLAKTDGWHYRFSECNDFLGNVSTASESFASALWALDFMHWEAAHDSHCLGVNFHNKMGTYTATIYQDANGDYHSYPKSAAMRMFNLGTSGNLMTAVTVSKSTGANVNAYAVGTSTDLWVTIVNKTSSYVGDWTAAVATIAPTNFTVHNAQYIVMDSSPTANDVTQTDATVGGSSVNNNSSAWSASWTPLTVSSNQVSLTVKSASAALVHLY